MEHSLKAYIRRLSTDRLEAYLEQYQTNREAKSYLPGVVNHVKEELQRRGKERRSNCETGSQGR